MEKAHRIDIDIALDSYRANNNKIDEIKIWGDPLQGFEYGTEKFRSKQALVHWLQTQKPNHEAIGRYIAESRMKYPDSNMESIFRTYEEYYGKVSATQAQTQRDLNALKPNDSTNISKETLKALEKEASIHLEAASRGFPEFQKALAEKGKFTFPLTGIYDNETYAGVVTFQRNTLKLNESQIGHITPETIRAVFDTTKTTPLNTGNTEPIGTLREGENSPESLRYYGTLAEKNLKSSGHTLTELQTELKKQHYLQGEVSGKFDEETLIAIKRFQSFIDAPLIPGELDIMTITKIFEGKMPYEMFNTKTASSPSERSQKNESEKFLDIFKKGVPEVQKFLIDKGYGIQMTGRYDTATREAVRQYQISINKKQADGVMDDYTLEKMFPGSTQNKEIILDTPTVPANATEKTPTVQQNTPEASTEKQVVYTKKVLTPKEVMTYSIISNQILSSYGKTLTDAQNILSSSGLYKQTPTGKYDQSTYEAVWNYQMSLHDPRVSVDGILGKVTIEKMFGPLTSKNIPASQKPASETTAKKIDINSNKEV